MKNSVLFQVFSTLTPSERTALRKWVRSPAFNLREDVVRLFDHLDKQTGVSERQLTKEKTFTKVFPGQPFDDAQLRHTMSYLMRVIQKFLIWSEMENRDVERQLHLARSFRGRGLDGLFNRTLDRVEQEVAQSPLHNADRHFQLFQVKNERYEAAVRQKRRGEMGLQKQADEFATYFAANLLRQACGIATHSAMTRQEYDIPLLHEVLNKVEVGEWKNAPAVQLYFNAYRALESTENDGHFHTLTILLEMHWHAFPTAEARDLFLLAINFCIKKINGGVVEYRRAVFDLYRSGLEKRVLLTGGLISPFTYNNVLNSALLVDEWEWAAEFLGKYKPLLPEAERENTYQFNLANFLFRKKEYGKAMELLRHVEFKDKLHNLDARRMLLRMYFETGEVDALESLLDSFETYIRRQKDLGYHGKNYLNLIRFVRRLQSIPISEKEALKRLKEEIESTSDLAERTWLLSVVFPQKS